jgi:hypothetical protein
MAVEGPDVDTRIGSECNDLDDTLLERAKERP